MTDVAVRLDNGLQSPDTPIRNHLLFSLQAGFCCNLILIPRTVPSDSEPRAGSLIAEDYLARRARLPVRIRVPGTVHAQNMVQARESRRNVAKVELCFFWLQPDEPFFLASAVNVVFILRVDD